MPLRSGLRPDCGAVLFASSIDGCAPLWENTSFLSDKTTPVAVLDKCRAEFRDAVNDDLNIPLALGVLWTMLKNEPARDLYETALEFDKVLGLSLDKAEKPAVSLADEAPAEIRALADARLSARKSKDWATSDRLRDELTAAGWTVADTKDGYTLKKL